jgi:hypothetical protein
MIRDLHLRNADPLGDLGLREVLREARAQHLAVTLGEDLRGCTEHRAAQLRREVVACTGELELQLLHAAGYAHHPRRVAEVAAQLAEHRQRGVAREPHLALEVEALNRLHEAERCDLHEIVERLAATGVPGGERAGEGQHLCHEIITRADVTMLVVPRQQIALTESARP